MELSKADITREIKNMQILKSRIKSQDFLDYIGKKCIEVLKEVTASKRGEFVFGKIPFNYETGHTYTTEINDSNALIKLANVAVNQFGEYYSAYIENGTGVFAEASKKPNGWIYPTVEEDINPTKKKTRKADLIAFTKGTKAKNIYNDAMGIIEKRLDTWIEEYNKGG